MNRFTKWINHKETEHYTKKLNKITDEIKSISKDLENLSTEELSKEFQKYKNQSIEQANENLKNVYAIVYVLFKKIYNITLHDVQLHGAIALYEGNIAEMRTGEGKTYTSALPTILNATIAPTHVVTVNEYLAKRDSEWMGKIFKFLGMTVGLNLNQMTSNQKRKQYQTDIMYTTNNELGFDYLRDNMVIYKEDMVQRPLNYAIVDEIDSILIDEARTPLIISGRSTKSTDLYKKADSFVRTLKKKEIIEEDYKNKEQAEELDKYDYVVNLKNRTATLTGKGAKKAEEYFGLDNLNELDNADIVHNINQALQAHGIMRNDIDYIVKDGEVLIVDEFTGRIMEGRRYSNRITSSYRSKRTSKNCR